VRARQQCLADEEGKEARRDGDDQGDRGVLSSTSPGAVEGIDMSSMRTPFLAPGLLLRMLAPAAAGLVAAGLLGAAPADAAGSMTPGVAAATGVPARSVAGNPNERTTEDALSGVSCATASACTAVGGTRVDLSGSRLAKAWNGNGTTWAIQPTPGNPTAALH
jgi:hypothetical protein